MIDRAVRNQRDDEKGRRKFMTLEEHYEEEREEGRAEGRDAATMDAIRNLMKNLQFSPEKAMDTLGIPKDAQKVYAGKL